jgi:hypothetical protein
MGEPLTSRLGSGERDFVDLTLARDGAGFIPRNPAVPTRLTDSGGARVGGVDIEVVNRCVGLKSEVQRNRVRHVDPDSGSLARTRTAMNAATPRSCSVPAQLAAPANRAGAGAALSSAPGRVTGQGIPHDLHHPTIEWVARDHSGGSSLKGEQCPDSHVSCRSANLCALPTVPQRDRALRVHGVIAYQSSQGDNTRHCSAAGSEIWPSRCSNVSHSARAGSSAISRKMNMKATVFDARSSSRAGAVFEGRLAPLGLPESR